MNNRQRQRAIAQSLLRSIEKRQPSRRRIDANTIELEYRDGSINRIVSQPQFSGGRSGVYR